MNYVDGAEKVDTSRDALFIYRYCHRDHPKKVQIKTGALRFFKQVKAFSEQLTGKTEFVMICDDTPDDILKKIEDLAITTMDNTKFSTVPIKKLPKIPGAKYPGRIMPDGSVTYDFKNNLYPLSITTKAVTKDKMLDMKDEDIIFYCEDDYIYKDDALFKLYLMAGAHDDFVSGYDCPTFWRAPNPGVTLRYQFKHRWWAGSNSGACATFNFSVKTLKMHKSVLIADHWKGYGDGPIWSGVKKLGKSKCWLAVPSLNYHFNFPG